MKGTKVHSLYTGRKTQERMSFWLKTKPQSHENCTSLSAKPRKSGNLISCAKSQSKGKSLHRWPWWSDYPTFLQTVDVYFVSLRRSSRSSVRLYKWTVERATPELETADDSIEAWRPQFYSPPVKTRANIFWAIENILMTIEPTFGSRTH